MLDYYQKGEIVKEMGLTPLEHLEHFVDEIKKTIPLSSVWITRRKRMSRFNTVASEQEFTNLPFVTKELKPKLIDQKVQFAVTAVRGPIEKEKYDPGKKRMIMSSTWYLDLEFSTSDLIIDGLQTEMTLSFAAGYEGRDKLIEALKDDLAEGVVNTVVLIGSPDWYSLGSV